VPGGPELPIEFSRISKDDKLTLVIDEQHGKPVHTRVATSTRSNLDDVVTDVWIREMRFKGERSVAQQQSKDGRIGYTDRSGKNASVNRPTLHPEAQDHQFAHGLIMPWLQSSGFDAVVWTALRSNYKEERKCDFSAEDAVNYLENLPEKPPPGKASREEAFEYIRKAPAEVETPLRKLLKSKDAELRGLEQQKPPAQVNPDGEPDPIASAIVPQPPKEPQRSPETTTSFHNGQLLHGVLRVVGGVLFTLAAILCIWGFAPGRFSILQVKPQEWLNDTSRQGWVTVGWALVPPVVFWLEYFFFADDLAKIAEKLRKEGKDETEVGKAMDIVKNKLGRLNEFRGVSVPIWAAVLFVLGALYSNNVKIEEKKQAATTHQTP
jgi:hypothetical protein